MIKNIIKLLMPSIIRRPLLILYIKKKYDVIFGKGAGADLNTVFEGKNLINNYSSLSKSYMGLGSYIAGHTSLTRIKIGRFCSIGQNVKNSLGIHPTNFISTHPAFFSTKKQAGFTFAERDMFEEHKYVDKEKKYLVVIGNDVWIGNNVILMDGITIGDGAIIGTGAIVTKDVEPYSIVGGIPAKLIRKRFSQEEIDLLLKFKWWNKDFEWIEENAKQFITPTSFFEAVIKNTNNAYEK